MQEHPLDRAASLGSITAHDSHQLALRPKAAAQALGISPRKLWSLTEDPRSGIPHIRLGRAVLYPVHELRVWLASQAAGEVSHER